MYRRRGYPRAVKAAKSLTISASLREIDDYLAHLLAFVSTCKLRKALTPDVQQRVEALDVIHPTAATLARAVDAAEAFWVDDGLAVLDAKLAAVGNYRVH